MLRPQGATKPDERRPRKRPARHHYLLLLALLFAAPGVRAQTTQPAGGEVPPVPTDLQQIMGLVTKVLGSPPKLPATAAGTEARSTGAVPTPAAAYDPASVAVSETGRLDLHVRDMDIPALLEMISYQAHTNIVTSTSVTGRVSANLYGVTLERALDAVLTPNQLAFHELGGMVYVGTPEEIAALQPRVTRVFPLKYIRPAEAAAAVRAVLGADAAVVESGCEAQGSGGVGGGGTSLVMGAAGSDYLIVTDQPQRLTEVEHILAEIDLRPRQVLIEATVLRATLNESNQLGVDFTVLGGVDFQNVNSTSNASVDVRTGQTPSAKLENTTFNVNTNFGGMAADGGLSLGIIKNNLGAFIRALEQVTDVVVVANPKVVALNKQEAQVIVGRRDGYLTTMVTETAAVQKVEFLETGTQIKFRPMIVDDHTVRLVVHPKDSNGGLTSANLPFEETTEAHADIMANDGDTVLIGGLFRERTVNTRDQIPVLGDVPGLGLLFGSRNDQTIREEVIILLTVHVLKESAQEKAQVRDLLDDIERVRVGSRQGLLATGRERLAQAFYQEAVRQIECGNPGLALLNARMSLTNQPKHMSAFKLKERLLGQRLWDDEGTRMRTFIWDLIRPDEEPAGGDARPTPFVPRSVPVFGRPQVELDSPATPRQGTGVWAP